MSTISKYICECKGVGKFEIVKSVRNLNACTFVDVQNLTKAATGCGRCKPMVDKIIKEELSKKNIREQQLRINFQGC